MHNNTILHLFIFLSLYSILFIVFIIKQLILIWLFCFHFQWVITSLNISKLSKLKIYKHVLLVILGFTNTNTHKKYFQSFFTFESSDHSNHKTFKNSFQWYIHIYILHTKNIHPIGTLLVHASVVSILVLMHIVHIGVANQPLVIVQLRSTGSLME